MAARVPRRAQVRLQGGGRRPLRLRGRRQARAHLGRRHQAGGLRRGLVAQVDRDGRARRRARRAGYRHAPPSNRWAHTRTHTHTRTTPNTPNTHTPTHQKHTHPRSRAVTSAEVPSRAGAFPRTPTMARPRALLLWHAL
eukprot:2012382-Prymnesium_polylepis.1